MARGEFVRLPHKPLAHIVPGGSSIYEATTLCGTTPWPDRWEIVRHTMAVCVDCLDRYRNPKRKKRK